MMGKNWTRTALWAGLAAVGTVNAADVEVVHWWTSGGEQKAVQVLAKEFDQLGQDQWLDTAIALGENARAVTMQRILGGDPPEAAQFNISRQFEELAEGGMLLDLTELAEQEGWYDFIRPSSVLSPCIKDGRVYCVPINIHSDQWIWTNKKVFAEAGVPEPATWDDFIRSAPSIRDAGYIPLAFGGQGWQENLTFRTVMIGQAGRDVWESVWRDRDLGVAGGPDMLKVFETFQALRGMVDAGAPGRNWNDATNMVISGKAAAQVMGDWARGEFAAAGLVADQDYGCIPGPSLRPYLTLGGDVFVFPKQNDPDVEQAQLKLASMMLNPRVQAKFNNAKGSLPVRDDVDMSLADACMKKGLALLQDKDAVFQPSTVFVTTDTDGQFQDLVSTFWNADGAMTPASAQQQFVDIIAEAD